ncbi:rhodanese-like domain-containing protein [Paucibacter sp. AS339]|uniref:rhodanese-like domain-containing protein n=1 Tax=Paucibacter hankyongi TaxID=3133434 RepID=UPI0030AFDE40
MNLPSLQLDPQSAAAALRAGGCVLLDVREAHEVARLAYDMPGVLCVPLSELERRHAELPQDQDVILACAAGGRSMQAMQYLLNKGHQRVRNLSGGMGAWRTRGLPVREG